MSQQGLVQASIRAITGSAESWEGDWHRLFDLAGIRAEHFNGRLLLWINQEMGSSYTNLPEAQQAFAESRGAANWSSLGSFDLFPTLDITQDDGTPITDLAGSQLTTG